MNFSLRLSRELLNSRWETHKSLILNWSEITLFSRVDANVNSRLPVYKLCLPASFVLKVGRGWCLGLGEVQVPAGERGQWAAAGTAATSSSHQVAESCGQQANNSSEPVLAWLTCPSWRLVTKHVEASASGKASSASYKSYRRLLIGCDLSRLLG